MANQVDGQSVGSMRAVTPSDTADISSTIGLSVNVAGNVQVLCVGDSTPVVRAVDAGRDYPWRVKRVYSTNTTATGIVALYQD